MSSLDRVGLDRVTGEPLAVGVGGDAEPAVEGTTEGLGRSSSPSAVATSAAAATTATVQGTHALRLRGTAADGVS